jgi:hypothetical protein
MNVSPDDMAKILAAARRCGDDSRDQFFAHVATHIKHFREEPLSKIVNDAVRRFGTKTNPSKRPK